MVNFVIIRVIMMVEMAIMIDEFYDELSMNFMFEI